MRKYIILILFLLQLSVVVVAQTHTVSGYVKDATTGENLLFAHCVDRLSNRGVTSDAYGFYRIDLPAGQVELSVSYLGYATADFRFELHQDTVIVFELQPIQTTLSEVVVSNHVSAVQQAMMGKNTVSMEMIKAIPSFVGEPDLMKSITFIPGVSGGREGYSNIYVRGGDRGQNLILLDGMKIYNTNHVGGFLSLFNSNVIKHVDVYKGGFPARYGGRASSVIDIYTKEGNNKELQGKYNIGVLYSGFMLEGPINEKLTFYTAGRVSYYDLLTSAARRAYKDGDGSYAGYTFFDVNSKLTWKLSDTQILDFMFFAGHDYQNAGDAMIGSDQTIDDLDQMRIHTTAFSARHHAVLSPSLVWENTLSYSNYKTSMDNKTTAYDYGFNRISHTSSSSKINDLTLRSKLSYYPNHVHQFKVGVEVSGYQFLPSIQNSYSEFVEANTTEERTVGYQSDLTSMEASLFLEDEMDLSPSVKLNLGIRATAYQSEDTSYYGIEPRVAINWLVSERNALKVNYTQLNQYNHVLVNNVNGFERELWLSATKELEPQQAQQYALGWFYSNTSMNFDFSVEAFYKRMSNLLEYQSPTSDTYGESIEDLVHKKGTGEAYGVEFQVKKDFKPISAMLNYTFSKSTRQFETLNNGKEFPFMYDRPHDFSLLLLWNINDKYSLNSNFTLSSGTPVTLPVGYSTSDDYVHNYFIYDEINNRRLPLYHRLDLSLVRTTKTKTGKQKQLAINIFNVYARQNPVYIYYNSATGKVMQKSMFSILPTITYSAEF